MTDNSKEAWIAELTPQILARMADQPEPDAGEAQMPEGLSAVEKMRWARLHQPPVVELQPARPTGTAPVTVPPDVLAMNPTDRMRRTRGTLNNH